MRSGLPNFVNAAPVPIFWASSENAVSASARLLRYCSITAASFDAATNFAGSTFGMGVSGGSALAPPRL